MAAENHADRLRVRAMNGHDVETELESRAPPRHPDDPVTEALLGQGLAIGGRRQGDAGVRVEVVHVGRLDQPVHGGVDRRRRTATSVEAVVERVDHLVLPLDARIDIDESPQPVEAQDRETLRGQRAEVSTGSLHPQQLDRVVVTGSTTSPFAEVLPPAKLVLRGSAPRRFDRATSSSTTAGRGMPGSCPPVTLPIPPGHHPPAR